MTTLDLIQPGQAQKEVTANRLFNAMAPAALFGIQSIVGLTLKVYGGAFAGAQLASQTLTLTDAATNFIEADPGTGAISQNTNAFTGGMIHLYQIVVAGGVAGAPSDFRQAYGAAGGAAGNFVDAPSDGKTYGRRNGAWEDAGAAPVAINPQGGSYTLALTDRGAIVRVNAAAANAVTVPKNADVAFPVGSVVEIRQAGAGQTTIAAAAGVTINSAETLALRKQHSSASLVKIAQDEWDLVGDLAAAA